jgi:RNA polymerase sigma-70 factor (ECF subfamily)
MSYNTATWRDELTISKPETAVPPRPVEKIERTDRQLVELVLSGDERAFEDLFERHRRLVGRTAARYLKRPEEVEEIIQIAFTKMYLELKSFRGVHELSLAGWLARITANACLDRLRSQRRRPENLECDMPETEDLDRLRESLSGAAGGEQMHVDRDLAEKLLSRLSAEDRVLLELLYLDELTTPEAAEAMGWSLSKAKLRAWRAKRSLQKVLRNLL